MSTLHDDKHREDEVSDAIDIAQCAIHDTVKDPLERDRLKGVLETLRAPRSAIEPNNAGPQDGVLAAKPGAPSATAGHSTRMGDDTAPAGLAPSATPPSTWVEVEKAKADAYEDAANRVEKLAENYTHEHGSYDPSTNAWELHHRHGDRIEAWDDAVEAIRKRKAEKCQVTHATVDSRSRDK